MRASKELYKSWLQYVMTSLPGSHSFIICKVLSCILHFWAVVVYTFFCHGGCCVHCWIFAIFVTDAYWNMAKL